MGFSRIAKRLREYSKLVMLSHILFSLPFAAVAVIWAGIPGADILFWMFVAIFGARNGANALNRIIDRDIDLKNPRTSSRSLPAGMVSLAEAKVITIFCFAVYFIAALNISTLCAALSPVPFVIIVVYSYLKRLTCFCHFVLGLAVAGAPFGAWLAAANSVSLSAFLLSGAVALWVSGFDILYALEDLEFDRANNLFSVPARFGARTATCIAGICFAAAILLLAAEASARGIAVQIGVIACAALLAAEMLSKNKTETDFRVYRINQLVGVTFLLFCVIDWIFG